MGRGGGGGRGGCSSGDMDEPLTPAGRFFLQPEMQQVINCAIGFQNPIDVPAVKDEITRTLLRYHPRMSCLLVRDKKGREHWRPAPEVDLDKHIILVPEEEDEEEETNGGGGDGVGEGEGENERYVNDYVAALTVSTPMCTEKPLWEVHVLPPRRRSCVLRLHHALGDGVSLMSLFLACCERADDPARPVTIPGAGGGAGRGTRTHPVTGLRPAGVAWRALLVAWYTLLYVVDMLMHSLGSKDDKNPITGGPGVELWPRRMVTTSFSLDDLKAVKRAAKATINDVLVGIVSYGLARYFELKSPKGRSKDLRVTGLAMVNTRQSPGLQEISSMMAKGSKSRWGNQFGFILLPIYLKKNFCDPLEYVTRAKSMLDRKKLSLEAHFSYAGGALIMSLLGPKLLCLRRIL
uniref:O-acyltransferase WSD1 n=1 Tax=Anthurium amnicola TaxID=1678845 RepID=A0A1D1Y3S4_9ARAE